MSQAAADALVEEAHELFRAEQFVDAVARFERAAQIFPPHAGAWKGLGHSLLCLGRAHEAARAFDQAIGLAPGSATALWGGAVAHAEVGNKVVAHSYLKRTLAMQPTWIEMARGVPQLAQFLHVSTRAADAFHRTLGAFSTRTYRHTASDARAVEIARIPDQPRVGQLTYLTIGLSNHEWQTTAPAAVQSEAVQRPRVELILASTVDTEVCAQILANLAFHLAETGFFPEPGVMVRDVIGALAAGDLSQRLPHVFIAPPRVWSLPLPLDNLSPPVTVAQVIPVSEAEYNAWRVDVAGFELDLRTRARELADLHRAG